VRVRQGQAGTRERPGGELVEAKPVANVDGERIEGRRGGVNQAVGERVAFERVLFGR
jgi:hypothetical protein